MGKEAQSGVANMNAPSRWVQLLLDFIYTDEIDLDSAEGHGADLFDLGARYELPRLVALVKDQFLRTLSMQNACERVLLAVRFSVEDLERAAVAIIKGNLSAVMRTDGWDLISKDPEVMQKLVKAPAD